MPTPNNIVLIRGGGDLATGVAVRLHRAGFPVIVTELVQPLSVRRAVSFSEAIYEEQWTVEGITARAADSDSEALERLQGGFVAVMIAPELSTIKIPYATLIDARLAKTFTPYPLGASPLVIGLGPGFTAGENCHAAIETMRGHNLGRVYWQGSTLEDTRQPEGDPRRVLRAPADGYIKTFAQIGELVASGQTLAEVGGQPVQAPFDGVLRGLLRPGLRIPQGLKIGDVDPRGIREYCFTISDKALAVGGGALEAILSRRNVG